MVELSGVTIVLLVVTIGLFILLARLVYRLRKDLMVRSSVVEERVLAIEKQTIGLKRLLHELDDKLDAKIDSKYLEKRIDGLIKLIKKSK